MDKASEVSNLLKEKDQAIISLETQVQEKQQRIEQQLAAQRQSNEQLNEQLIKEKQRIDQHAVLKKKALSQALNKLKIINEQLSKSKDEHITQLSLQIERFKEFPKVEEFKSEALQITKALSTNLNLLCNNISLVPPFCEISSSMIDKSFEDKKKLERVDETLTEFIYCKETKQRQATNVPEILEPHKEILFLEWKTQLMKAERETLRCRSVTGNLVELINDTLYL